MIWPLNLLLRCGGYRPREAVEGLQETRVVVEQNSTVTRGLATEIQTPRRRSNGATNEQHQPVQRVASR